MPIDSPGITTFSKKHSLWFGLYLLSIFSTLMLSARSDADTIELTQASIADFNKAFDKGTLSSEQLVKMYMARINAFDEKEPKLNAVLEINKDALTIARSLDQERKRQGPRSPVHGIPVLVKDVFDTYDMSTTGGFLPLKGVIPDKDSTIVKRLRDAGAIILAKVNQSDWYSRPDIMASSTLGGSTLNPFALDRTPGWSSSGTGAGLAAHFGTIGLGSETGFSIRTPTSDSNLFGLSTTSGLISRSGQMWSYITGERGGPMAHNVFDLAVTLDVIAGFDSADLWTANSLGKMPMEPYVSFIDKNGLRGARVGVLKEAWDFTPVDPQAKDLANEAISVFSNNGAKVFESVSLGIDLPNYLTVNSSPSRYERIAAINAYLAHQGPNYPFKNAEDLLLKQSRVEPRDTDVAQLKEPVDLDRDPEYRATLAGREQLREMVISLMDRYALDALIYPHKLHGPLKIGPRGDPERDYKPNQLSPTTGLPALIVPMGFTKNGLPVGLEILGRPWSEPTLIRLASGFEALTDNRRVPKATPPLTGEEIEK